jgi:hypothetical protein
MLARSINRFNLSFGIGYDFAGCHRRILFAYRFSMCPVSRARFPAGGCGARSQSGDAEVQQRADQARGMDFQLGI